MLEGLALQMQDTGIFYGQLVYFEAIWYILWPLSLFCENLVHFPRSGNF
jgi:hypothetical protein